MNKKFIISRYKEDYSWIKNYTDNYLIYNKGEPIHNSHIINTENIGGNQRDIFKFVYENYNNLPQLMAFMQACPFDHCNKEKFDKIINNEYFTSLESYEHLPETGYNKKAPDGGYMEINNSWYITSHNATYGLVCKYPSFDAFMDSYFKNYTHIDWIRFAPGSQYIVERKQVLYYPQSLWFRLMSELSKNNMTEAHIIERALWLIFQCAFEPR